MTLTEPHRWRIALRVGFFMGDAAGIERMRPLPFGKLRVRMTEVFGGGVGNFDTPWLATDAGHRTRRYRGGRPFRLCTAVIANGRRTAGGMLASPG
jgi:hypothetical protein